MNAAQLVLMTRQRKTYQQRIRALFGANLAGYWPLDDTSGTAALDASGNNRNGLYVGSPALAAVASLAAGKNAPAFDGSNDQVRLHTAVGTAFTGAEFTVIFQTKVSSAFWTNGTTGFVFGLQSDVANNTVTFNHAANNRMSLAITAGGTGKGFTLNGMYTDKWFTIAVTRSESGNRMRAYVNGSVTDADATNIGTWAMNTLTTMSIADYANIGVYCWEGAVADFVLVNREATASEIRQYSAIFGANRILSIVGDSISSIGNIASWNGHVVFEYGGGNKLTRINHAVANQSIIGHMAAQAAATAGDNASVCIMALGTNDDNAGNMATLQATVEAGIDTVRANNPGVTIYYLNVLPRWTDVGGGTPVDKSNIRTAIAAACTAKGVTCWDTFTTPWITSAQTQEGLHPIAAGQLAISAQVLARLP